MDFVQNYALLIHRPPPSQNPSVILMNFRGCTPPRAPPLEARARGGARRLGLPPQRRVRGRGHAPSAFPLKGACAGSPSWALRRGLSVVGSSPGALHRGLSVVGSPPWGVCRGLSIVGSPLWARHRGLSVVGSSPGALHRGLSVVGSLLCPPCLVVFFFARGTAPQGYWIHARHNIYTYINIWV